MSFSQKVLERIDQLELENLMPLIKKAVEHDSVDELYPLIELLSSIGFYEEVTVIARRLAETSHKDEMNLLLAEIAIEDGQDIEALTYLEKIPSDSSFYPRSLLVLADYYQMNGFPELSEKSLLEAKKILPHEIVIDFALAELYFSAGRLQKAKKHYEKLLQEGHSEFGGVSVKERLGAIASASGHFEEAVAQFQASLSEQPHVDTHFKLGLTFFQQQEWRAAIREWQEVIELDPYYPSVYPLLAQAFIEEHDLTAALEATQDGLKIDQTNGELYLMAAELLASKPEHLQEARNFYEQALKLDPENDRYYIKYIQFLMEQEDFVEIEEVINDSPESVKRTPELLWIEGQLASRLDHFEKAASLYQQVLPDLKTFPPFLRDYFLFLIAAGDNSRAQVVGREYLQYAPEDSEIKNRLLELKYQD